ncbi:hypothetical protein HanRHA438_Chr11g0516811 [Helianthus annuus]|nr:hypothetical protein HanRHA438_Chr11g0516811 [Helianthus annuus]
MNKLNRRDRVYRKKGGESEKNSDLRRTSTALAESSKTKRARENRTTAAHGGTVVVAPQLAGARRLLSFPSLSLSSTSPSCAAATRR